MSCIPRLSRARAARGEAPLVLVSLPTDADMGRFLYLEVDTAQLP